MTALQVELAHLVSLMAPPYREYWKSFCWAKAVYLAESNPQEYRDLPRQLKEAMTLSSCASTTTLVSGIAEVSTSKDGT